MRIEVRAASDRDAAMRRLRCVERRAVDGATVEEMTEGAALLDVIEAGAVVGAVAVDVSGRVATITAAASGGRHTAEELALIERMVSEAGCELLGLFTRRGALVRQLAGLGYRVVSVQLEKEIHGQQEQIQ